MQGEWVRKPKEDAAVVFVHGILSDGQSCWTDANGSYWPAMLAEEADSATWGIYVFTYKTGVFSGSFRIGDIVDSLKEHMRLDGVSKSRRIVFVAHSMGGIVVRKYLVERAPELIERLVISGLFLLASPSLGAKYANWLSPIIRHFHNLQADALRLSQENSWLLDLDKEFNNLKARGAPILLGKEIVEDRFIVHSSFFRTQVVEPFAGARYFGEPYKVPDSDHFTIAKPSSRTSIQHRLLVEFIDMVSKYKPEIAKMENAVPGAIDGSAVSQDPVASRDAADSGIAKRILDFQPIVSQLAADFVGREFVFAKLREFLSTQTSGYFVVSGRPGTGKSALLASLVIRTQYAHHFNIYSTGVRKVRDMMGNLTARVASKHGLRDLDWSDSALNNGHQFEAALRKISAMHRNHERDVLIVDALDEGEDDGACGNSMCLPESLPRGIFIVCSTCEPSALVTSGARCDIAFEEHEAETALDLASFIGKRISESADLRDYLNIGNYSVQVFTRELVTKSEGNFRYCYHVLNDIESASSGGILGSLAELPVGLEPYYAFRWRRMQQASRSQWNDDSLPVLLVLGASTVPISRDLIANYAEVSPVRVSTVLREWNSYIQKDRGITGDQAQVRYRYFHLSFTEFVRNRGERDYQEIFQSIRQRMALMMLIEYADDAVASSDV